MEPPQMNTSQLLLISSIGLAVNLFGMFAMGGHHHHVRTIRALVSIFLEADVFQGRPLSFTWPLSFVFGKSFAHRSFQWPRIVHGPFSLPHPLALAITSLYRSLYTSRPALASA